MTTRKHAFYGILALVSLLGLGITQSARANLINNGDFETGSFSGWTVMLAPPSETNLFVTTGQVPDETNVAYFGATGTNFDTISQTFMTTVGAFYTLTFFYQVGNPGPPLPPANNEFRVLWNGTSVGSPFPNVNANPGWGTFTYNLQATGALTTLEFDGRNHPYFDILDDVSVNVASVPDAGSTLPLLSFASLGLVALRRKLRC